jgi:hemerythrin
MEPHFLIWTKGYSIGHAGLDAEHRQLVDAINRVCVVESAGGAADELTPLLDALVILAVEHFKHENTLLRELDCLAAPLQEGLPAIRNVISASAVNEHCAEHARSLLQLESIMHISGCDTEAKRESLGKTLIDWFTEHALEHDADLKNALQAYLTYTRGASAG